MSAPAVILDRLLAAGLELAIEPPDTLVVRGPREIRARWLPAVRVHKLALLELLAGNPPAPPSGETAGPEPPASLGPAGEGEEEPVPAHAAPELVACASCLHFKRDTIGDGSGLGSCLANAPASRQPGSLWPGSTPHCSEWTAAPAVSAQTDWPDPPPPIPGPDEPPFIPDGPVDVREENL